MRKTKIPAKHRKAVIALLIRAATATEDPVLDLPDFELDDILDDEDLPPPGLESEPTKYPEPAAPISGTKSITIRVHQRVIRSFKDQADKTGGSYQTLMNQALQEWADRHL